MADIFNSLIRETDRVITIVGGGGKTALMFLLAHAFLKKKSTVITTTTTRILKPASGQTGGVILLDDDSFYKKLEHCLKYHGHATVAQTDLPDDKLGGIHCNDVEQILKQSSAERILIEADGARQLPFKAAGDNEPVVPEITDIFVSVVGLDAIGHSLDDTNVFRAELVSSRTGLQMGAEITPLTVARLAVHPEGLLKGCPKKARSYIFLNKMDIQDGKEKALSVIEIAQKLEGRIADFWTAGSVKKNDISLLV